MALSTHAVVVVLTLFLLVPQAPASSSSSTSSPSASTAAASSSPPPEEGGDAAMILEFSGHIVSVDEASQLLEFAPGLLNATDPGTGTSALIESAKAGHTEVCRLLLARGAYVDHVDAKGRSALLYATLCSNQGEGRGQRHHVCPMHLHDHPKDSHLTTMHVLLGHNAHADLRDSHGRAALHYAALSGHTDVVSELLGHKQVEAHIRDSYDWTPLHHASMHGYGEVSGTRGNCVYGGGCGRASGCVREKARECGRAGFSRRGVQGCD